MIASLTLKGSRILSIMGNFNFYPFCIEIVFSVSNEWMSLVLDQVVENSGKGS